MPTLSGCREYDLWNSAMRRQRARVPTNPTDPAPRGHAQVPPELLARVDELLIFDPLAITRRVAEEAGVSRDTVHRRRKKLVANGKLPDLSREELGIARSRLRFANLDLEVAPRRPRLRDCSVKMRVWIDGEEFDWTSEPAHFRGPSVGSEEDMRVLRDLVMHHYRTHQVPQIVRIWPELRAALDRMKAQ